VVKGGIPDNAFNPLEGDDRETARALKRRNRSERSGERELLDWQPAKSIASFADLNRTIDAISDDTPDAVREKKRLFAQAHTNPAWQRLRQACDLWTAAFFQPLASGKPVITTAPLLDHLDGRLLPLGLTDLAFELSERNGFFHWPLEFPGIFAGTALTLLWAILHTSTQLLARSRSQHRNRNSGKAYSLVRRALMTCIFCSWNVHVG
jgi:hypothetical protein